MSRHFELSGHRGARGLWPENTLVGFAGALRIGVDALEMDVALTADGVPVAAHNLRLDPDLARWADGAWLDPPGPALCRMTLAALRRLDVGRARPGSATAAGFPRQCPADGERVPTLAELFRLAAAHPGVRLDVELKTDPSLPDLSPDPSDLAERVLAAADAAGVAERITLRSFDWRGLRWAARLRPGLPLCFLSVPADAETLRTVMEEAGGAAEWAPGFAALTPALIADAQRAGIAVKPWTVNRRADMARLIAWGVDGFCTDDPDVARDVMAEAGLPLPPIMASA